MTSISAIALSIFWVQNVTLVSDVRLEKNAFSTYTASTPQRRCYLLMHSSTETFLL